jgi:hypothetical protein
VEPAGWAVGDLDSTFQEWVTGSTAFLTADTPPSGNSANPALSEPATMGVNLPGFVASSGGYYSFGGDYGVFADILNHGGSLGTGGPYPANAGTRVLVQVAATMNTDANVSVNLDSVQVVSPNGSAIAGGCNSCSLQVEELALGPVETSFGIVPQQELLFEFWLPDYTDDFRVEMEVSVHSSFQHLRIDSRIESPESIDPDFDQDGDVDGADILEWQRGPDVYGGAEGLDQWKQDFGTTPAPPLVTTVPEPSASALLALALLRVITHRYRR